MNKILYAVATLAVIVIIGVIAFIVLSQPTNAPDDEVVVISSFADCVAAGYPVMESYPRQCRVTNGATFTEPIDGNVNTNVPVQDPRVKNVNITTNQQLISPVTVTGEAVGTWYFEASFPIRVVDSNNVELGVGIAQAQGDWMTTNFVPFSATIAFATSTTPTGELVLQRDNPSGLPENDAEVRIPIQF